MSSIEKKYEKLVLRIAENIKIARYERELSQKDMEKFGFDLRNYQRLEAGRHSPSLYTLHKVAEAFELNVRDLLT